MNLVLNRTVVVDSDWRFDNLCGSHLLSHLQSFWLWRWVPHRLSKRQSLSTTTVLFSYVHPDDQTQPFEMTPGFKPFTVRRDLCHSCNYWKFWYKLSWSTWENKKLTTETKEIFYRYFCFVKFVWWNKKISIIQAAISVKNILIYLYSICKVLVWMNIKYN